MSLPAGVMGVFFGCLALAMLFIEVRKERDGVLEKVLAGMCWFGLTCLCFGLGGLALTTIANAQTLNSLSGVLAVGGLGLLVLAPVAGVAHVIWRRRMATRRT